MVETVITIKLKTTVETFESSEFHAVLDKINNGELKRDFENGKIKDMRATITYWTNYKTIKNQ